MQSFNSTLIILVADLGPPYNLPRYLHIATTLAACFLTIISQLHMFRWTKPSYKSTTSYEPKTPKINSISLPDDRNSPKTYQPLYERPSTRNSYLKRFSISESRPTTPLKESRNSIVGGVPPQSKLFLRTRTVSASVREVEAPRPIRPHPSQGPFIPLSDPLDRVIINPSRGAAIEVPSAAFLEEKIERQRMDSAKSKPSATNYMSQQDYHDGMRKRAERANGNYNTAPSKAWFQEQEENARRYTASAAPIKEDDDDFRPIPVVNKVPNMVKAPPAANRPLKSALKQTPSIKKQELEPLFKPREYGDSKAYYSENDTDKRRKETVRPYRVTKAPSKAYLEEQKEKLEDLVKQHDAAWHPQGESKPAKDFRPPPFQHSSSSGSPNESVLHKEYNRSRRASNTDAPLYKPTNYMPAYVKDSQISPQWSTAVEPHLEWPLVEYDRRRHLPEPLVYFDAGFDPREHKFEVCIVNRGHRVPLARDQRNLVISTEKIVIKNESLKHWPIYISPNPTTGVIRVIDVFRAIYDTYAVPLTRDELAWFGRDYIQRCEPAFLQRCRDSRESTHYLEKEGMRRIDLLRGKRIFRGVVQRADKPKYFELLFDRGD